MTFKPKLGNSLGQQLQEQLSTQLTTTTNKNVLNEPTEKKEIPTFNNPEDATEKIRIIFDDSGSMSGDKIKDARDGCIEFMRNCRVNETACAIHLMNPESHYGLTDLSKLTTNLPALSILISKIEAPGRTPLFETLKNAQATEPKATRYIVFSDGSPGYGDVKTYKEQTISFANENKTPIDTVLIVAETNSYYRNTNIEDHAEYILLKELADRTGGYFLVFDKKKVNFKDAFKYLAPSLRAKLADGKIRLALMAGELK